MKFTEKQIYAMFKILCESTTVYPIKTYDFGGLTVDQRRKLMKDIEDQQTDRVIDVGSKEDFSFPQFPDENKS